MVLVERWGFLGIAFAICVAQLPTAVAQNAKDPARLDFDVHSSVSIESKRNSVAFEGSYLTAPSIEPLPAGKSGLITVEILNTEDFDLPIQNVSVSCGCTKAELLQRTIKAGESAELRIWLKTPEKHASIRFSGYITLDIDSGRARHKDLSHVRVLLNFDIDQMLSFKNKMLTIDVHPGKQGELRIPFISTLRTPMKALQVEATGDLTGFEGSLKDESGEKFVSLVVEPDLLEKTRGFGSIVLSDPESGASDTVTVVMDVSTPIKLVPSVLRFRPSDSGDKLTANAIFRVLRNESSKLVKTNENVEKPLHCEASVDGKNVSVDVKRASDSVYRIAFTLDTSGTELIANSEELALGRIKSELKWRAITSDTSCSGSAAVVLPIVVSDSDR